MSIDRYAVIGHPVAHSLSPRIHHAFAAQTGESLRYERIEAPLDGFAVTVSDFLQQGGRGCNVTVPFKGEAAAWVTRRAPAADFADAVNTIVPDPAGGWVGHNTDGSGLVMDLRRLLGEAEGLRVLLLGAGGAARGVALPLLQTVAGELIIANRTAGRAASLAARLTDAGCKGASAVALDRLGGAYDLIINATSAGLADEVPDISEDLAAGAFCYDMVYSRAADGTTAFCRWAQARAARATADGLGMLVGQAALAFELWRGVRPQVLPVLDMLRRPL